MSIELLIDKAFPLKEESEYIDVAVSIAKQFGIVEELPVTIEFDFYCRSVAEFPHLVSADGHKWIVSALVAAGVLPDRRWSRISGFVDRFFIDEKNPRVVVRIV